MVANISTGADEKAENITTGAENKQHTKQTQYLPLQRYKIPTTTEHSTKEKKAWLGKLIKKKGNTKPATRTHITQ